MHNSFLIKYTKLYYFYSKFRSKINYEKYLYLKKIRKGNIVLDIGANHGYYTSLFSEIISCSGHVHAFEPVPETYSKLNSLKTNHDNISFNQLAVGRSNGTGIVRYNLMIPEKASLVNSTNTDVNEYKTQIISIDDYVNKLALNDVNFIKCDVEGYELEVIAGSIETLNNFKPKLSIEVSLNRTKTHELYSILLDAGYSTFLKIEKGYPFFNIDDHDFSNEDYFYLYAFT